MTYTKGLTICVASFIDELVRMGIKQAVISPGSRSTPLTILFNEHPGINVYMNIDERSAGFFALGLAKASNEPTALICTSGTAAANYFPSIIEAKLSRVPLIVITSDRPHELRKVGAPQSIDQIKMFGDQVKEFIELPVPDEEAVSARLFRSQARRIIMASKSMPMGPVHINLPFREPLVPDISQENLWTVEELNQPFKSAYGETRLSEDEEASLTDVLKNMKRGLIVAGPQMDDRFAHLLAELGRIYKVPILADPLSQLRTGPHNKEWIIDSFDAFLRDASFSKAIKPDVIIRFGSMPVSKPLLQYISSADLKHYLLVDSGKEWLDPTHKVTEMVYADPVPAIRQLIASHQAVSSQQENWGYFWKKLNETVRNHIGSTLLKAEWYEGPAITELVKSLPEASTVFVGNSMPIRDLDTFLFNQEKPLATMGNRGANGIDGITSTALGVSVIKDNTHLIIGDLSFFHDMNGLMVAKQYRLDITIIVINNNGGGIFSFLPQADSVADFEKLFGTPANLDISLIAQLYQASYFEVKSWEEYRRAIRSGLDTKGLKIIEVKTNRETNTILHRGLWKSMSQQIKGCLHDADFN